MRQPPVPAMHSSPLYMATPSKLSRVTAKRRHVSPPSLSSASSVIEPREPVPALAHGTAWPPSTWMSAEETALPIVVWSESLSLLAGGAGKEGVLEVTIERSTCALSKLKPPAPQPARGSANVSSAALALAEAITLHCPLSKACAIRDNRRTPPQC